MTPPRSSAKNPSTRFPSLRRPGTPSSPPKPSKSPSSTRNSSRLAASNPPTAGSGRSRTTPASSPSSSLPTPSLSASTGTSPARSAASKTSPSSKPSSSISPRSACSSSICRCFHSCFASSTPRRFPSSASSSEHWSIPPWKTPRSSTDPSEFRRRAIEHETFGIYPLMNEIATALDAVLQNLHTECADAEKEKNALKLLSKVLQNLLDHPDNPKVYRLRGSSDKLRRQLTGL
ncbi:uncharacterized protein [Blastocystis hominis]|uniref:Uncharacterized protein n=1 Tax=Blastocystis hominis TaxID=12968 RepID=D8M9V2_BLAHO|nr:uncharacterized protein [Blastocystis hominis]CBK24841.2 unnamed protein product [Blastocystis hominis]|eukprot:XP_012898889.1 uncharacterized protein [Blastocystis hominis]